MRDIKTAILDATERRIKLGGFGGFTHREIAVDVGIKSSSVHYHFSTKEALAAAVVKRWTRYTLDLVENERKSQPDAIAAWTKSFRGTAFSETRMCPCTVLAAASQDLPNMVSQEVKIFFSSCQEKLISDGLSANVATKLLATMIGALVVANALGDPKEYDRVMYDQFSKTE